MSRFQLVVAWTVVVALVAGATAFLTRDQWLPWIQSTASGDGEDEHHASAIGETTTLRLSPQALANLDIKSKPVMLQTYWRTVQVPGVIVDRPGQSDRGVPAPVAGVVSQVHAYPGDTVRPGEKLVTLRIVSEYLQNTQSELYKTAREVVLNRDQRQRLAALAEIGAAAKTDLLSLDNQYERLKTTIVTLRHDLISRGLTGEQVNDIEEGRFVNTVAVFAPRADKDQTILLTKTNPQSLEPGSKSAPVAFEVQELKIELGQQVQPGQTICFLANHQSLYIEGRGFKRDSPFLERAAQKAWPVQVDFSEDDKSHWPPLQQQFYIRHLANSVDPQSRTFAFFLPLANQSRSYEKDGATFLVWRFRPGQRVRLRVPMEEMQDVIVLPAAAVVREGPEAFVFQQNGELFKRRPVHVLVDDGANMVLANDKSLRPEVDFVAQASAATLNRVLKAQATSGGLPPGAHFHADGSLHIPGQ